MFRLASLCSVALMFVGCAASSADDDALAADGEEDAHEASESDLTSAEKAAVCANVKKSAPFTDAETARLLSLIVQKSAAIKQDNDRLIRERGIGARMGNRSQIYQLLEDDTDPVTKLKFTPAERATRKAKAHALVQAKLKPGLVAETVLKDVRGTSCIGFVYEVLRSAYADMGRSAEWATVEKCGRAWDSDGLHVQQALIATGWPGPTLPFVTDEANTAGPDTEKAMLSEFRRAITRGSYYGTPVSKTTVLKNFLPMPGSSTVKNDAMLRSIGSGNSFGLATFRGAYHVPLIVPAASVPSVFAPPAGAARAEWLAAKSSGEAFMIESHASRNPWDDTNFEIRPLTAALKETYSTKIVYSTGTILFAPNSDFEVTP
jgi:hypothetical protein